MNLYRRPALILCTAVVLTAGFAGCEDEDARQRASVQAQIDEQARNLSGISSITGDGDAVRQELEQAISALKSVSGGAKGQQGSKLLLSAGAHRDLAGIDMRDIQQLESEHARSRGIVHDDLEAALRYHVRSEGQQGYSADAHRTTLRGERESAEQILTAGSREMSELDGPIQTRRSANRDDHDEIAQLETRANDLRRQAAEAGPRDGLDALVEAVEVERRADLIRADIARREIELGYDLDARHDLADKNVQFARASLAGIDESMTSLDAMERRYRDDARASAQTAQERAGSVSDALATIGQSSELAARYESAISHLETAISEARNAANQLGRQDAAAANLIVARSLADLARVHASRARGLDDHRALLSRLSNASMLGETGKYNAELQTASTDADTAREAAKTAYNEAIGALGQVSGPAGAEADRLRERLQAGLAGLDGRSMPVAENATAGNSRNSNANSSSGGTASGAGFASPQEIADLLDPDASSGFDIDGQQRLFDATIAETPLGEKYIAAMKGMINAVARLESAIEAKLGSQVSQQVAELMAAQNPTTGIRVVNQTDSEATISFRNPQYGGRAEMKVVNQGGSWFVIAESAIPPAMNTPEAIDTMLGMAAGSIEGLADQIESGALNAQQLTQMLQGFGG